MVVSGCTYFPAEDLTSFCFMARKNSTVNRYCISLPLAIVIGHLRWLHDMDTVNNAVMNTQVVVHGTKKQLYTGSRRRLGWEVN